MSSSRRSKVKVFSEISQDKLAAALENWQNSDTSIEITDTKVISDGGGIRAAAVMITYTHMSEWC